MKKVDGINIGIQDVRKRKTRSILTGIAIAVGCMLLVAMQGMGDTINKTATSFIESFGDMSQVMVLPQKYDKNNNFALQFQEQSNNGMQLLPYTQNVQLNPKEKSNEKKITNDTLKSLSKIEGVKNVVAYEASRASEVKINGVNKNGESVVVLGYDSNYKYIDQVKVIAGKDLTGNQNGVLVKKEYLEQMGVKDFNSVIGKKITLILSMPSIDGITMPSKKIEKTIEGVYENKNSYYPGSIMGLESMTNEMQAYYSGKNVKDITPNYSMVTLNTTAKKYINPIMKNINNNLGYTTFNLGEVVGLASIFTSFVGGVLDIGAIIVIIVASVGLINTMTMTIQEKKKWIGIMRSIGAKKGNIVTIFLAQAIFIGILGGIVGCILAVIGIWLVNIYLSSSGKDFHIILTWANLWLGFIVTVVVSTIAGIIPAIKAAKLNVIEIINEE